MRREIVLYVPSGGHPATIEIARGSAIVGEPRAGPRRSRSTATQIVPRDALLAVGTFDFQEGCIRLTGSDSERVVAACSVRRGLTPRSWARQGGAQRPTRAAVPDVPVTVTRSLGEALIERAGIRREGDGTWVNAKGRRTSVIAEALVCALVAIAGAG